MGEDGGNFGEESITLRFVLNNSEIHLLALWKVNSLLIDLATTNDKNVLNLRLHFLTLSEDESLINRLTDINMIRELKLSRDEERRRGKLLAKFLITGNDDVHTIAKRTESLGEGLICLSSHNHSVLLLGILGVSIELQSVRLSAW